MNSYCRGITLVVVLHTCFSLPAIAVETVRIGNPRNEPDMDFGFGGAFGDVPYVYRIGTYEVTNQQYTDFLNAVAQTDDNGLYNEEMGMNERGGISREVSERGFEYSVRTNMADKPVNFVSLWDAARYSNWLHNEKPEGIQDPSTTEAGAYSLDGGTTLVRSSEASWFIPSEDEWYKAAYHQPAAGGGDENDYWLHARRSNQAPTQAVVDEVGNIINGERRSVANYGLSAEWAGLDGHVSTVGSGGPRSASFYGTFDQAGNVEEWTQNVHIDAFGSFQVFRGGSFATPLAGNLGAGFRSLADPSAEAAALGFRVATVPEPASSGSCLLLFLVSAYAIRQRRKAICVTLSPGHQ